MLASFDAQRLAAAGAKVHVVFLWAAIIKSPRLPALCVPEIVVIVMLPLARSGLRLAIRQRLPHNWQAGFCVSARLR
jgi:hypothetical protein